MPSPPAPAESHPLLARIAGWAERQPEAPALVGATPEDLVDRWLFAGNRPLVKQVRVAGREVVADGQHVQREGIARRYGETLRRLLRD